MSEMVYCTMRVAIPPTWIDLSKEVSSVPWFVDDLSEAFFDGLEFNDDMSHDRCIVEIEGQLNYGSSQITSLLLFLELNHIPFHLREEAGSEWDGTWTLFDGVTLFTGLLCWNTGAVLSEADIDKIMGHGRIDHIGAAFAAYFNAANIDLKTIEMPTLPVQCPPRPQEETA